MSLLWEHIAPRTMKHAPIKEREEIVEVLRNMKNQRQNKKLPFLPIFSFLSLSVFSIFSPFSNIFLCLFSRENRRKVSSFFVVSFFQEGEILVITHLEVKKIILKRYLPPFGFWESPNSSSLFRFTETFSIFANRKVVFWVFVVHVYVIQLENESKGSCFH